MGGIKVKLLTGRSLDQGKSKERGKLSEDYVKCVAVCEFNKEDLEAFKISPGQNVRVSTDFGSVVVRAAASTQQLPKATVFMPYGPWTGIVVNPETHGTGMPSLKGLEAEVSAAPSEKILSLKELVKQFAGR